MLTLTRPSFLFSRDQLIVISCSVEARAAVVIHQNAHSDPAMATLQHSWLRIAQTRRIFGVAEIKSHNIRLTDSSRRGARIWFFALLRLGSGRVPWRRIDRRALRNLSSDEVVGKIGVYSVYFPPAANKPRAFLASVNSPGYFAFSVGVGAVGSGIDSSC